VNISVNKAEKEYDDFLFDNDYIPSVISMGSFCAIYQWLNNENKISEKVTQTSQAIVSELIKSRYEVNKNLLIKASSVGNDLANAYFEVDEDDRYFRPFIKNLGIFNDGLNPVQLGNFIIFLLLLQVIVEDKEDLETSEFYTEQIKTIIYCQLDGGEIYDQSLSIAQNLYDTY